MQIRLAGIVNDSIVDGPGIRFSIFTQGCGHKCPGCQNPQAQDRDGGELSTTDELMEKIAANRLLKGVTLTGGEPFDQAAPLVPLARWCHEQGLDVWAYSGYLYEELLSGAVSEDAAELLHECDVLVDGPFLLEQKSMNLKWRGSANQRVIDVARSLEAGEVVEYQPESYI